MVAKQEVLVPNNPQDFQITPKTSYGVLQENARRFHGARFRERVASDIISNAKELTPEIDETNWAVILGCTKINVGSKSITIYKGRKAVANSLAPTMASIALGLGCDLHDSPIVYLCAYYFSSSLEKRLVFLQQRLEQLRNGERKFINKESGQVALEKEEGELESLKPLSQKLATSIEEYAKQNQFPLDYLQILQRLLILEASYSSKKNQIRGQIISLLIKGEMKEALSLANQHLPVPKKSN